MDWVNWAASSQTAAPPNFAVHYSQKIPAPYEESPLYSSALTPSLAGNLTRSSSPFQDMGTNRAQFQQHIRNINAMPSSIEHSTHDTDGYSGPDLTPL